MLAAALLLSASAEGAPKKKKPRPGDTPAADGGMIAGEVARMTCRAPDEIAAEQELVIECDAEEWLEGARIELNYRSSGKEGFTAVTMEAVPKGPLRGKVPAADVRPPYVHYYIQAAIPEAGVVAATGKHDTPSVVQVQAPPPPPAPFASTAFGDPNGTVTQSAAARLASFATGGPRAPGSFWVGLTLGSGYGWSSRSRLEYRSDLEAGAGFGPAGLGHLSPEVGYQITPNIAVALAGRHQFISGGGGEPAYPGQPARWAHSVLARGLYVVDWGPFGVHGAFQAGAGDGFRFRFAPDPVSGRPRHDTTRGGPFVFGPGVGLVYRLRARYALVAESGLLFGVPDFALMTDLNLGLQVNL